MIDAVVFDMDGVLIDSEQVWDDVRRRFTEEAGGSWLPEAQRAMMGMSSTEWSAYMRDHLRLSMSAADINARVVERVLGEYRTQLPLLVGAVDAVRRVAARYPVAIASSSNRPVIDAVLDAAGLTDAFTTTVSSEEVARGKPAPDVYLAAAAALGVDPGRAAAVEDSTNGLRAAMAAGMFVVAVPNRAYPPDPDVVARADVVLDDLRPLSPATFGAA